MAPERFNTHVHVHSLPDAYLRWRLSDRESTIGAAFLTQTVKIDDQTSIKFEVSPMLWTDGFTCARLPT